jgi:hypothetical protein
MRFPIPTIRHLALLAGILTAGLVPLISTAHAGTTYNLYAPPHTFGPWTHVGAHAGSAGFKITATPLGNTAVVGEVQWFDVDGRQKVSQFHGVTYVRTCNCYGTIKVRLKGIPLGSAVTVTVN